VISCHLQDRIYLVTVGYICYPRNNHVLIIEWRPGGVSIVKQQGKEVLGVDLSPCMLVKDRFAICPHVMLNACLTLSWLDNSFRPQSRVAQLRRGTRSVWVRTLEEVRCVGTQWHESMGRLESWASWQIGVPEDAALGGSTNLVPELYQRWPKAAPARYIWICVRNNSLAG
jgi:hypothetical protein